MTTTQSGPVRVHQEDLRSSHLCSAPNRELRRSSALPDWNAVAEHFDRKGTNDLNYLCSEDGVIVHHHSGFFDSARCPTEMSEEAILRELGASETRLTLHGARLLRLSPGQFGFDCGCGRGGSALLFARHYGVAVDGITISSCQAAFVQQAAQRSGLDDLVRCRLENVYANTLPSEKYDFVWACESTEYMADRGMLLSEFERILRPRGKIVIMALTVAIGVDDDPVVCQTVASINNHYVTALGTLDEYFTAAAEADIDVVDVVQHEEQVLPYWRLRLASAHRTGSEVWLIDGLENGFLKYSTILCQKRS